MKTLGLMVFVLGMFSIPSGLHAKCKLDLGLVVDRTRSIKYENVPKLKAALEHLVKRFDISRDETHVSFATFARRAKLHNKFKDPPYQHAVAVQHLINTTIMRLGRRTRLDRAMKLAKERMFTPGNGLRDGVKAMVLYTDGRSHPKTEDCYLDVVALKMQGVRVIVVGIGPDAQKPHHRLVLEEIAGENLVFVDDYASLDDHTDDIVKLICPPGPCENSKGLDVAILLDRTRSLSIGDYILAKGFFAELVGGLDIGPNATRLGLIRFAKNPRVDFTFADEAYHDQEAVIHFIENLDNWRGRRTFIDRALLAANNELFTPAGGDREEFPNTLILLTDGRTNPRSQPFGNIVPSLQAKQVRLIAIGVGDHERFADELEEIAGNHTYTAENFDVLSDLFQTILDETCSVDGGFSRWGFWSECSVSCGLGTQTRNRTCTHPPPHGPYGADCDGPLQETRACNEGPCP